MVTPSQYRAATQELARLAEQHDVTRARLIEDEWKELHVFSERKDELSRQEREAKERHTDARKAADEAHLGECAPFDQTVWQTRRLFTLMGIARSGRVAEMGQLITFTSSYPREKVTLPHFDVLAADEYKQVGVWTAPNGKPKNKFTLTVHGWSLFAGYDVLGMNEHWHGYLNVVHDQPYANIKVLLRDGPDEADLRIWYAGKREGVLRDYLAKHAEVEAEYREAAALLRDAVWLRLYLEDQKDYYEHHHSHGMKLPEYRAVLAELASLAQ